MNKLMDIQNENEIESIIKESIDKLSLELVEKRKNAEEQKFKKT